MLLLKKATDSTLEHCSARAVKSSFETDVLRLINPAEWDQPLFFCMSAIPHLQYPSRIGLSIEKGKKRKQALAGSN